MGRGWWQVENEYLPKMGTAYLFAGAESVRLGGDYLLRVELSPKETARLFFATHKGDLVQTFKSLFEDEERQAEEERRREQAEREAAIRALDRRMDAQMKRKELLEQFAEKLLNMQDETPPEPEPG